MNERCCHNVLRTCRIAASTSGKPVTPRCHRRRCSWSELQRCAANHGRNGLSGRVGKLTRLRDAHRDVMHIGRDRTLTSAHDAAGSNMRSRHAFQTRVPTRTPTRTPTQTPTPTPTDSVIAATRRPGSIRWLYYIACTKTGDRCANDVIIRRTATRTSTPGRARPTAAQTSSQT